MGLLMTLAYLDVLETKGVFHCNDGTRRDGTIPSIRLFCSGSGVRTKPSQ